MRTRLCDLLDISLPIIGAPFGPWNSVKLAAAICESGGLGSLGTAVRPAEQLKVQWAQLRELTDRAFAINHQPRPFSPEAFEATLEDRPAVISYHMGDPGELVDRAHLAGSLWMQQVMDLDQARRAVDRGADIIIAQGSEAGGHSGLSALWCWSRKSPRSLAIAPSWLPGESPMGEVLRPRSAWAPVE